MSKKNHCSIKDKFIDVIITVSSFSFAVTFIASIILLILYLFFMFGNANDPVVLKENSYFALGTILSIITIFLSAGSVYYSIEYFFPLEKFIPIYILATTNIITFAVSVILYVNLLI